MTVDASEMPPETSPHAAKSKADPAKMALRANPDAVTRLSKSALMMVIGGGALVIFGAFAVALKPPSARGESAPTELYNVTSKPVAEAVSDLPKSYAEVVQQRPPEDPLGQPMLGDVGRSIVLERQRAAGTVPDSRLTPRQPVRSVSMDARRSDLFFQRGSQSAGVVAGSGQQLAAIAPNGQGNASNLVGDYRLTAGTLIPASLITGINSDLPGAAIAQVTQNVYDSLTGDHLLIPQGARLIGTYSSDTNFGQKRAFISWSRLINPDGTSLTLNDLTASDLSGYSGLRDRVDNHTGELIKAGVLSTILGVGAELAQDDDDDEITRAIRDAMQGTANTAGQKIIQRQLSIKPTIKIRPGWSFQVIVTEDLKLPTYRL